MEDIQSRECVVYRPSKSTGDQLKKFANSKSYDIAMVITTRIECNAFKSFNKIDNEYRISNCNKQINRNIMNINVFMSLIQNSQFLKKNC